MKIVFHDYGGYPFIGDISSYFAELGHEVWHLYSSSSGSPNGNFIERKGYVVKDLERDAPPKPKNSFVSRFINEFEYGKIAERELKNIKPDIVISSNTPLLAQYRIINYCKSNNIKSVFWFQDILSFAARNVLRKKNIILGKIAYIFFFLLEKYSLDKSDAIISISDDFKTVLEKWGISENKIFRINNWAQIALIPMRPKKNAFSQKYGISETFNFIYTGTLGMKQDPDVLVKIARKFRNRSGIRLIVVGIGEGMHLLNGIIKDEQINNVQLLPLQPYEDLPQILAAADVLVASLKEDSGEFCVPSKLLTYYCSGKPSLLSIPADNQAAQIASSEGIGFVAPPGNNIELDKLLDFLISNPNTLIEKGDRARKYAEREFDINTIGNEFEKVFEYLKLSH